MSLMRESKRIKTGDELNSLYERAVQHLSGLSSIKTRLTEIKTEVDNDSDTFTPEDSIEVTAKQDLLSQAITNAA